MKPGISVIIPSYNGERKVSGVLESLTHQHTRADEVILVIDGSSDHTKQVATRFADRLPLRIIEIPNKGRAGARNTGVAAAGFELLVFFDDDMRLFPDCLQQHQEFHRKFSASILGGSIQEDVALFTSDIQRYRITLYERKGWIRTDDGMKPLKEDEIFMAAANLSMHHETFERLGGFDERLRDAEDFDMANRACTLGIPIYYNQKVAKAYHDDLITCRSYILRQREYIRSLRRLYEMKPDLYAKYLHRIHPQPSMLKRIIYFMISNRITVWLIDREIMKYLLPSRIRYPLFDYIINGLIQVYPERKL